MPYLTSVFAEQIGKAAGTATVRAHWTFGDLTSDAVEVRIPVDSLTPPILVASLPVDSGAGTPAFTDFAVPAPNILSLVVSPRTLDSNGNLNDRMPDDLGADQFWETFSMQTTQFAVTAEQQPGVPVRPPAPIIQTPNDIGQHHVGVLWVAGFNYDSYFVNITEKAAAGQPQHPPLTIHHDDDGTWGFQRIDGLKPGTTYIVQVQGCTERFFGIFPDHCYDWSAPVEYTTFPPAMFAIRPPAGAHTAALQQQGVHDQTDVFVVDGSGVVNVCWVNGGGLWKGPHRLTPEGMAPPGAWLAASPQWGVDAQTDVFFVDNRGGLNVLWVHGGGAWNGPVRISPEGMAPPGAGLAASAQFGLNQTDVFFIDHAGAVSVMWAVGGGAWNGPFAITHGGIAPPGAPVVASPQWGVANQTDVFFFDNAGGLNVLWVHGGGAWNGPVRISPEGIAPPGAVVVASPQWGLNQTDVFFVDHAGAVCVMWAVGGGIWNGPHRISSPGFAPPGSSVPLLRNRV
jgi:hypothetical protein